MALEATTEYKCVVCASDNLSVIRQDADNPKLKCNDCMFVFNGKDSVEAAAAGAIPPSSPETLATATEPDIIYRGPDVSIKPLTSDTFPKSPSHLFIDRDRTRFELCSKRDFKKTAVRWSQGVSFDIYELKKIRLNVKVDVQNASN